MTVLVTGGAGYIGSHCVNALLKSGREVVVLDHFAADKGSRVPPEVHAVAGDIADEKLVGELIERYRVRSFMHFAGLLKVEESVREPERYLKVNWGGTKALLRAATKYGVPHFIFSSTAAVYGLPAVDKVGEDAPLRPINPYGESKVRAEGEVRRSYPGRGVQKGTHVILRFFNVAGADPQGRAGYTLEENPTHLIRTALRVARGKKDCLKVFGTDYPTPDGTCIRDYIHVLDLVQAHLDALRHLEEGGNSLTLNCGYGHGYSVLDVHSAAQKVTGKHIPLQYAPRRPGDPAALVADATLIKQKLSWKPEFDDLEKMIEHQWKWELSQDPPHS